ncbi:trans-sialidase [Trypanosoma cruzi]|nr:trans-sialidase [Trypanosoma cruzi]
MLTGVPFSYSIAAAPNLTPSSTKPPVHSSRRFLLGVAEDLCVRCGGRSSGHKSGAGPRRGHPQRHHCGRRGNGLELRSAGCHCEGRAASFCPKRRAQRHDEAVRFSGGVLRVADDGGTKTQSTATRLA